MNILGDAEIDVYIHRRNWQRLWLPFGIAKGVCGAGWKASVLISARHEGGQGRWGTSYQDESENMVRRKLRFDHAGKHPDIPD
ncbi:hypothetical protein GCM10011371_32880 [Novosphingobium marinum]|nr:hypothetical protein GCM10011371_32880 [Novosphingobium marinum]